MLEVKKEGILLNKTVLDFENEGVLNPAAIKTDTGIHLFYRAVREGNHSTIGYCRLRTPLEIEERFEFPVLTPQFDYESKGLEDPRIVRIDDLYYLTYTGYDGVNALGALAVSRDLITFEKKGVMVPRLTYGEFCRLAESKGRINEKYLRYNAAHVMEDRDDVFIWDKNVIFFPRRIDGQLYFLHRIRPDIQIANVSELSELTADYWEQYFLDFDKHIVLSSLYRHEESYIGGGCPPIETELGWLLIYHGVHDSIDGYVYGACAALLDLQNPRKEIARLPYALFTPEKHWETVGYINNVCFPTGAVQSGDTLYIYYGAADEQIACASISMAELLKELMLNTKENGT